MSIMNKTAMSRLIQFLTDSTVSYRKGETVEVKGGAVHLYAFPATPERAVLVDVHFINIGFTEQAADRKQFDRLLLNAMDKPGAFSTLTVERLRQGPSYIELGGWIGSQQLALQLMATGDFAGLWKVVTPALLGITGPKADELAGQGFVMIAPSQNFDRLTVLA